MADLAVVMPSPAQLNMGAITLVVGALIVLVTVGLSKVKRFKRVDARLFTALGGLVFAAMLAALARGWTPSLPAAESINRIAPAVGVGLWVMIFVHFAVTTNRKIDTAVADLATQIGISVSGRTTSETVASMIKAADVELQEKIDANRTEFTKTLLADAKRGAGWRRELKEELNGLREKQDLMFRMLGAANPGPDPADVERALRAVAARKKGETT
jgi:hypothetical protein